MRNISAEALAKLTQQQGGEPLNIIEVQWTQSVSYYYADRTIREFSIKGAILSLSNLENVINISGSSSSQSISITLNDTDGSIKTIYNNNDFHKRPVKIYQWFTGLHFTDKFLIFQGEINSPIVWKESDRTISFEVVSRLEDAEAGYSPEEGEFASIPDELIGKAWPLPFGTCLHVPALRLDSIPTGASLDANIATDYSIDQQGTELGKNIIELAGLAQLCFITALSAYSSAYSVDSGTFDGSMSADEYRQLGDQFTDKGNKYLAEMAKAQMDLANLFAERNRQKKKQKSFLRIAGGECYPQGTPLTARIAGVKHTGVMAGGNFIVDTITHPNLETTDTGSSIETIPVTNSITTGGQDVVQKVGFAWVPAGKVFILESALPVRYIVAMLPVTIINVWAERSYDGARILTQVPTTYYSISTQSFGAVVATIITFLRPLSHLNEGWDDSIFVDLQSPIGPNTVDIIQWLIGTYSNLGVDAASFAAVRERVSPFPSNFCLFDRQNIVQLLSDIVYQARCAIWLNNGIFYLRYLVDEPTPVETFSESDVQLETLEIHHTETEELVTKLVASYKTNYAQDTDFKIILRNNVPKYGTHQKEINWYIYNHPNFVDLAATFWIIRESNTWKTLLFRTPIHKLRVETFDAITINFGSNYSHIGSIVGIVISVKFDSEKLELEFEVWLPVRLGEMTKYNFAWPVDSTVNVYPDNLQYAGSQGPGELTNGDLDSANGACQSGVEVKFIKNNKRRKVHHGNENPGTRNLEGTVVLRPAVGGLDVTEPPPSNYNYRQYRVDSLITERTNPPQTVPAKITGVPISQKYPVEMYTRGLSNPPSKGFATQVDPSVIEILEIDTWVMVSIMSWSVYEDEKLKTYSATYFLPSKSKPGVYAGKVVSGSGSLYTVNVFKKGVDQPPESVPKVRQLQIDPADTVPANTWCIVGEGTKAAVPATEFEPGSPAEKEYFMQVPVWLE